jgi:hypothetical protein
MSLTLNSNQNCFAVAVLAVLASAADAGMYESTYTLNTPYTASSPEVTHVLVNFSTSLTTGVVGQGDLTDWSISLYGAGGVIYTDSVIVGGSVQSIGGITRGIADVLFQFDLNTFVSGDFDNVLIGSGLSGATGTAYNIYSYPNSVLGPPYSPLGIWSNGIESTRQLPGYSSVVTAAVPAPGACAALALVMTIKRRRRG